MKSLGLINALEASGSAIVQGWFAISPITETITGMILRRELRVSEVSEAEGGVIGSCAT